MKTLLIALIFAIVTGCAGQTPQQSKSTVRLANKGFNFLARVADRFLPPLPPSTRGLAK